MFGLIGLAQIIISVALGATGGNWWFVFALSALLGVASIIRPENARFMYSTGSILKTIVIQFLAALVVGSLLFWIGSLFSN